MEDNKIVTNLFESTQDANITIGGVPMQTWSNGLYDYCDGLAIGTIFMDLHRPFYMGGDSNGR